MSRGPVFCRHLPQRLRVLVCLGVALGAAACSGNKAPAIASDASGSSEVGAPFDGGLTADTLVVGNFAIEMIPPTATDPGRTTLLGVVSDGPTPESIIWDLVEDSGGGCRLFKPTAPFCSPPCGGGQICVANQKCASQPVSQDLGPIRITGLGSKEFTVTPILKGYQLPVDVTLPFPPADEGANVGLAVTTGPYGPFALSTKAVAPLSSTGVLTIQRNSPAELTWEPPGQPDIARMRVKLDISHHGGSTGKIECDVADNGSLEISASLITKLIDLGVAGFPRISLSRVSTGIVAIAPGAVTLQFISSVVRDVEIPGFTSCNDATDCPDGKACLQNSLCQQ